MEIDNSLFIPEIRPFYSKNMPEYSFACYYREGETTNTKRKLCRTRYEATRFRRTIMLNNSHKISTGMTPLSCEEMFEYSQVREILKPYTDQRVEDVITSLDNKMEILKNEFNEELPSVLENIARFDISSYNPKKLVDTVDEYLALLNASARSNVYKNQNKMFLGRLVASLKDKLLTDITPADLRTWVENYKDAAAQRLNKPLADSSVYNVIHAIQVFFNYCKRRKYIRKSPARDMLPRLNTPDPAIYTIDEIKKIIKCSDCTPELKLLILLALYGGFRLSELLQLRVENISILHKDISVGGLITKTHLRRRVKLPDNLMRALPTLLAQIEAKDPTDRLFKWNTTIIHASLNGFFASIGVKRIRNGLRHTAASYHLCRSGSSIDTAEQLGNSPVVLKIHYTGLVSNKDCDTFYSLDLLDCCATVPASFAI